MAIETTKPEYTPELVVRFEDSGNFTWERKNTEAKPRRIKETYASKNGIGRSCPARVSNCTATTRPLTGVTAGRSVVDVAVRFIEFIRIETQQSPAWVR